MKGLLSRLKKAFYCDGNWLGEGDSKWWTTKLLFTFSREEDFTSYKHYEEAIRP